MLKQGVIVAFFSKEMTSLVQFSSLTSIHINAVVQPFIMAGEISDYLHNLKEIPVYESFETAQSEGATLLLIGFTKQLSKMRGTDYLQLALNFAISHGLDVFSFENINEEKYSCLLLQMNEKGLKHYCPLIKKKLSDNHNYLQDMVVNKDPNGIMIVGTSSNQGKFTLMLRIMIELKNRGINFRTIGSEHQSALFGIDSVFPYGVAANVMIPMAEYPDYLQKELGKLYKSGAKYVLSCSQSGLLPYSLQDIYNRSFTLSTISFFFSLMPGKVIIVVNSGIDSDSFIKDTITFIENVGQVKVVALAFSNMERVLTDDIININSLKKERISMIKQKYFDEFDLASFNIMDDGDIKSLVNLLVGDDI
ncbi:DUF1611 domain-containing protein [Anaerocolumna sp. MB42-C2]|uniref:DUF1611 domain-containing protein n=1 Tax=Anaerocolumna sp. MB42-C2 TaxID=3070997 RepID=UPI0027E1680A|nr:DUF1611 domain-containing protein [Anaerocolumna sp. MB42-C2]WMJ86435.1 DUF1611 domain-containing protein [Anaerocolumna sp. MB42-C2]